jgi:hypothetical protein
MSIGVVGAQGAGAVKDPLELFKPMMPVFSDPHCAHRHGSANPLK